MMLRGFSKVLLLWTSNQPVNKRQSGLNMVCACQRTKSVLRKVTKTLECHILILWSMWVVFVFNFLDFWTNSLQDILQISQVVITVLAYIFNIALILIVRCNARKEIGNYRILITFFSLSDIYYNTLHFLVYPVRKISSFSIMRVFRSPRTTEMHFSCVDTGCTQICLVLAYTWDHTVMPFRFSSSIFFID